MAPVLQDIAALGGDALSSLKERTPRSSLTTPTRAQGPSLASLFQRQATVTVTAAPPADNSSSGNRLSGGAIAGIVIGSIVGFLLLLWIIRSCFNLGAPPQEAAPPAGDRAWYDDSRRSRSRRRSHSHHSSSHHHPRRSTEVRAITPVLVEDRVRRPSKTYVYESGGGRREQRRASRASRDYY